MTERPSGLPVEPASAPASWRGRRDLLVVTAITATVLVLSVWFDVFEAISRFSERHDEWQLDEIVPTLVVLAIALAVFSVLRWRDLKREIEARRLAEAEATEASHAKSDFLARMSHEIRTPLNGVIGMTELALETPLSADQREYLDTANASAHTLLSVINDVLDFSKIEAGKLQLERVRFSLRDSLATTMRVLALEAHQKGLELSLAIRPDTPDALLGDPARIRQVVINLVANAIKFTERGEVVISVAAVQQDANCVVLRVDVRDTGVGITADKQERIFEAFEQADGSTSRTHGGTGLGLAISVQLVHMMGGTIGVESAVGHGSTFSFTAALDIAADQDATAAALALDIHDVSVLIVDDNETNRHILRAALCSWGMQPVCADGGEAALHVMAQAAADGAPFQLVLLDVRMPQVDGFAVAERIKNTPILAGATILMLTSDRQSDDLARCEALGVSAYLIKPITQAELRFAILDVLGMSEEVPPAAAVPDEPLRPLRILVAEDNVVNLMLITRLLEKRQHTIVAAHNGFEVLAALEQRPFDLVLMDVEMPDKDGLETTLAIRAAEQDGRTFALGTHRLPIIALTAHAMKSDQERCRVVGMDGYVTKPINTARLFAAIRDAVDTDGTAARHAGELSHPLEGPL